MYFTSVNMRGSQHVQHFMDLSVKEGLKITCIQVETCRLCNKTIIIVVPDVPLLYFISTKIFYYSINSTTCFGPKGYHQVDQEYKSSTRSSIQCEVFIFHFLTVKFQEIKFSVELRYMNPFPHSYTCNCAPGYVLQVQTFYFL